MRKKSILITGCSTGIGYHAAKQLHEKGYQVIATARKAEDVARLTEEGLTALQCDVDDSASIRSAVSEACKLTQGRIDCLINNAGFGQTGALEDISRDVLRKQFETNVFGLQDMTNAVIPIMRQQGHGRIINISSVLGFITMPYRGAYNASKFAVEGLSDTLRQELRSANIQVSLIEPGPIESQFRDSAIASFDRHLKDKKDSAHQAKYETLREQVVKDPHKTPFLLGPDAVLKKILHALESHRPKPRYHVTLATHLLAFLKRILSTRALDALLRMMARDEH